MKRVVDLGKKVGVDIDNKDISVAHRTGPKTNKSARPVLVKFTSRRCKANLMMRKKELGKQNMRGVYLNDELTPLRFRLLKLCKAASGVDRVSTTHDGKIACLMNSTPRSSNSGSSRGSSDNIIFVESPDDLFKIGVTKVDYSALGLQHFVYSS